MAAEVFAFLFFFFSSRRRHTRCLSDWSSDVCSSDLLELARYRRNTVGLVFQSFNLLPRMTLEENVELPLRLAEVERGERAARVQEALERVRLAKRTGHRPSELSGGKQQRTAIARALVNRP